MRISPTKCRSFSRKSENLDGILITGVSDSRYEIYIGVLIHKQYTGAIRVIYKHIHIRVYEDIVSRTPCICFDFNGNILGKEHLVFL